MKKKLLITGSTFPRYEHDTEPRFVLDLAVSLSRYAEVTVLVPAAQHTKVREILEGVPVLRYHYFAIHNLETLCYPGAIVPRIKQKKVRALLVPWLFCALFHNLHKMRHEYDIVLANWLIPQGIVQSYIKKPYYVIGHGGDVTSLNMGIIRRLKCRCLRKAKGVFAVSTHLGNVMNQIAGSDITTQVISMGCDTKKFGLQYRQKNYFNQGDKSVILYVGRLAEKKGVTYLIDAMQYLEECKLVIVGDGPLRQSLELQADNLYKTGADSSKSQIVFLGAKNHEELKSIYASADIFAMPSITAKDGDQEGFGLVMLEAFASGLPVVASDSGGIRDLIQDGVNGYLVPEKNSMILSKKIRDILVDRKVYQEFSKNALCTAKNYDYDVIGERYARAMGLI